MRVTTPLRRSAPARASSYRVVTIDRDLTDEGLSDWWNGLPQPQATPVLRWEYLRAWADAFMPASARLAVDVVFDGEQPVAALPLYRCRGALWSLANDHSDLFDAGWNPGHPGAVTALAGKLVRHRTRLTRVPWDSPLLREVMRAAPPLVLDRDTSPYLELPATVDELMSRLSSRFRANVRKAVRTLTSLGELHFTQAEGGTDEAAVAFAAMRGVEARSWKGRQGRAIDSRPETRRFYRALALDEPVSRWTRLAVLRAGDRVVAAQLDLEHASRRIGMRTSFVDDLPGRQSPGLVLLWFVLADEIARGVTVHDFGGGPDAWKLHWTSSGSQRVTLRGWPLTIAGRMTYAARETLKPVVKPVLHKVVHGADA